MTRAKDISKIITDADFSGTLDVTGTVTTSGLTVSGTGVVGTLTSSNNNTVLRVKGNGATTGGAIGSTSSDDLVLLSGVTERMRITNSGNVGIGNTSPNAKLQVIDQIKVSSADQSSGSVVLGDGSSTNFNVGIARWNGSTNAAGAGGIGYFAQGSVNSGGHFFYTGDASAGSTTERMRIESSGDFLFLGNTIRIKDSGNTAQRGAIYGSSSEFHLNAGVDNMVLTTSGGEAMRITSLGNVGIGTTNPESYANNQTSLTISDNTNPNLVFDDTGQARNWYLVAQGTGLNITYADGGGSGSATNTTNAISIRNDTIQDGIVINDNSKQRDFRIESDLHSHAFFVDASNGNVLIKGSDSSVANTGFAYEYASDYIKQTSVSEVCLYLNRRVSDGTIQEFRKDNVAVGKIITQGGNLIMASGSVGVGVGGDNLYPANGSGASSDNVMDVGDASARFDDVYATNGTIQTSDRNEKQDIEELSEAEQRVAIVAKGLMRKFRWKDKVAEKGDNARTHFGIIAQDLQDAFTAEGLDAGDYAMFTSTTWTDDDGNEQTRLGVRYNQLLAFIISAI